MIPPIVESHLRARYGAYEHHVHAAAMTAQQLAAVERASASRVAKVIVVELGGELALAVIAATDRINLAPLEEATGAHAELAREPAFEARFRPCETGAEPPVALFGLAIYVDDKLAREQTIVMAAGTHEDAVVVPTSEWMWCERARPLANLGRRAATDGERLHADDPPRGSGSAW